MTDKTLAYYNNNADDFVSGTVDVDFSINQNRFLDQLTPGAYILDFGCGSGRDTKYFLDRGYEVDAVDGSEELCRLASSYTGVEVRCMLFQQLAETAKYDGIWACASILHLNKKELRDVLMKMTTALKEKGIIYTSFKYGEYEGERNGRYFTDFTLETFKEYIDPVKELEIEEYWISGDARPGRENEKWLNLILRKK